MSPLDRQNDNLLDAQPQTGIEGGELNGGFSQQPHVQAWHESGSADDLSRSLLQVQQQEAWLQSQSGSTLLDQGTAQVPLLRDWAAAAAADSPGEAEVRTLVVVHTGLPNWQQQLPGLGQHDDLLLVPPDQGGIRLVQDALVGRTYDRVQLLLGETWSSDGSSWQLGRDALSGNLQQALALEPAVAIDVVQAQAIATTPLDSADELLGLVRQSLQIAMEQGRLEAAVVDAFSEASRAGVLAAAKALLQGEQGPQLQWARFQQSSIRGAFLQERNAVLISEQLQNGGAELEAVLLEELGHWLESASADDSHGDEGERFSAILRGHTLAVEVGRDRANLLIDGEVVQAELAQIVSGSQQQGVLSDNRNAITLTFDEPLTSTPENWSRIRFNNASGIAIANFPAVSHFSIESNKLTIHLVSPVDTAILTNGLKVSYDADSGYGGTELSGATGPVGSFSAFVNFTSPSGSGPATSNDLLSVTLTGTNNAPVISAVTDVAAAISELADGATGENATTLSDYGFFSITDVDLTDVQSVSVTPPNAARGFLTAQVSNNTTADGAGQINWSYSVSDAALDTLAAGQLIQEVFTLTVSDGKGGSVNQLVTVTLTGTNDAPNLTSSTGNGAEDTNSTSFMAGSDPEGSAIAVLRVRDTGSPSPWVVVNQDRDADGSSLTNGYGTLRVRPFGTFNFLADGPLSQSLAAGQQAQVSFTYEATDGLLISSSTVAFTLTGSNDVPTVVADNVTIQEDAVLIREASQGVLANDVDVDTAGSQLRIFKVGLPGQAAMEMTSNDYVILSNTYGTLLMRSNGAYSFVADGHASQALAPGQSATTSFIYQAWDGITINDFGNALPPADPLRATSTLSITITGTNDAPLINGELNLGPIQEDGSFAITTAQLLASTTDIDSPGSSLSVVSLSVDARQGQITPVTGSNNNSWTFTPAADWSGTAELRYVISDGTNRSSRSNFSNGVQLKGDRLFLLTTGASWANAEQQAMRLGGRLTSIESSAQQASLEEMFSFRLDQPLWIGFNDAGQEGTWTWNDGSAITFTRWRGFSPWGSITPFNPNQTWGGGGDTDYAVLMADQATGPYPRRDWGVRPGDGSFSNLMGIAEIPYFRRGDSAYVIVQGPTWEQAEANAVKLGGHLVTINDAAENEWLISNGLVGSGRWFGFSDQNSEGDWRWSDSSLTNYRNWSSGNPDNSTASNVSEGQDFGVIGSNGYWDDGENPLWPGTTPLSGIAEINLAAISRLVVSPVDDAPRLEPDQATAVQDQHLSVPAAAGLLANDRDPEAAPLQVVQISSLGNTPQVVPLVEGGAVLTNSYGTLVVGANGAYTFLANGPDSQGLAQGQTAQTSFSYVASDGGLQSSGTLTITVTGVNDAPVLQNDQRTLVEDGTVSASALTGVLANDQDPDDGTELRVVSLRNLADTRSIPSSGTTSLSDSYGTLSLAADGSYSFNANGAASQSLAVGQSAQTSFTLTVSDGVLSRESTLSFTVTGSNDAPRVVAPLSNLPNGVEGAPYPIQTSALLAGVTDPDQGDALRIRHLIASGGTLAASGDNLWILSVQASTQVNLGSAQEDTPLSFSVDQLLGGSRSAFDVRLSYEVEDGRGGSLPVQRTVSIDRAVSLAGADVTQLEVLNGGGVASRQSDGSWLIQPTGNRNGLLEIAYIVQAGTASTRYTASCILEAVNDPPARSSGPLPLVQLQEDAASTGLGLDNLSYTPGGGADESNQTLTYRIHSLPASALGSVTKDDGSAVSSGQALSLEELRLLRFTPAANASGSGELQLGILDSGGGSLIDTLNIEVNAVNDPAVIGGTTNLQVVEDTAVQAVSGVPTLRRTGQFSISDVDGQAEAAFQTSVLPINGPLGQLQLSSNGSYTYSLDNSLEVVQALRQGEQRVDSFEIRSVDGSSRQVSFTIQGSADNTRARLIDGYIAGAKVFVDLNNDGQLNWTDSNNNSRWDVGEGEAWVATDSQGGLVFDFGSPIGHLRSLGGTDTSTGLAFTGSLSAPAGSGVITPLTSLILQMSDGLSGGTPQSRLQAAENSVRQALGIAPGQPLNQLDPIAALANPQLTTAERQQALAVQQRASQIANLISISEATGQGGRTLIQALVAAVQSSGNTPLDLASSNTVSSLLNANRPSGTPPIPTSVVGNLATANSLINQATNLQTVVSSQQMAQGDLAASIIQLSNANGIGWIGVGRVGVIENSPVGTVIAHVQYKGDSSQAAAGYGYRMRYTDPASDRYAGVALPFNIDPTGLITVGFAGMPQQLDYENNPVPYALTVEVADFNNGPVIASFDLLIAIENTNEAPQASPDSLAVDLIQNQQVARSAQQGLLSNDSDPDANDALRVDISAGATLINSFGTLVIAADGSYSFSADGPASRALAPGAMAQTSFSYTAIDALGLTSSSVLNITITGRNDPPFDAGITPTLAPGQVGVPYVLSTAALLQGVSDPDAGDTLQIRDLQITGGTAVDNGNGTWTISSGPGSVIDLGRGPEHTTRTFGVLDLLGGSLTSQRLDVSYRVVDAAGEALNVSRGLDLARPNALSSVAISGVQLSQGQGTVTDNGNGTWSLAPDPDFTRTLAITYQLSTGGQPSTTTATFGVLAVNDAPSVQVPAAQQLLEDMTLSFSIANGNQLVVADVDANTLELRLHVNVGTLTLAPAAAAGITVLEGSSGVSNLLRISGTAAAINAALDGLVYTPLADRSGSDELTLQLSDRGQSGAGGNQATYARVPIAITAVPGQPAPAGRAAALVGINTAPQLTGTQAVLPNTSEDQISTFTSSQLLQGFSDPDQGDQLRVENVRVSSGNGRLAVDATGQWTFTPEVNANGGVTLAYDVIDGNGGRVAATNGFTINAVNDAPRRLDDGPKALYVIEDGAITPLGLANLAWSTGAERDPLSDQLRQIPVADEASQTLTFTITTLPDGALGEIGLLDANANNAFVALTAGQQLSLAQLKGLQFRAAADAYGAGTFTYAVSDGAAAQGGLTTTETFTINVLAVNDAPVRTSPELAPRVIGNTELVVDRATNLYQTVTVGMANLLFNSGADALEQASQQLLYRISRLPNANVGQVTLADGSVVLIGNTYTLPQLRDLVFRPARGVEKLTAAERLGELRLQVTDTPNAGGDPARTTELKVPILIDTNKASGRAGARIAGLTSDEQAIQAVLALDPTNPDTGFQNPVAGNGANQAMGQAKGLNTSLYSQLESDNPLYLAAIGGNTLLDGQDVNYAPSAVPFLFDLPINAWAPTSWANGGPDPTHTLLYRSTLSGQLRSNDELTYAVAGTAPGGFTLSSSGAWSFDPLDAAYAGLTTEGATQQVTARYQAGTRTGELTIELRRTASTVIAEVVGNIGAMTTSRGDWIAANPEGRDKDRYFKYISEYVLTSYGAIDSGERNDDGEKIFAWDGAIATADGQPLRQLDGTVITTAGYYDFTRRDGQGDGVEFVYETVSEKGKQVDYIVGMRFFLRNNFFGDNDPAADNIRDPGAPVTILRELGVITAVTLTQNETVRINAQSPLSVDTRVRGSGAMAGLAGTDDTLQAIAARASVLVSSGSAGDTSSGLIPQITSAGDDDGTGTGSGDGDSAGKGAGVGGLGAGADKVAKGRGPGDGGDSTADGLGKGAGERGLRLDPLRTLATAASATPESLLSTLSDTNILGANLLDALALGAGLLYLLYGPKAVDQGKRGLRGWLAGVAGGGRRGAVVPGEQLVLSLILTRQENGLLRLVAAQLTAGGVRLVAQQDLASAATDAEALQAAASALLAGLQQQGQRYDLLLLDGQLEPALSAADQSLAALAQQRLPLASTELAAAVAAASPAGYASLQQWLNKPSQTLPPDSAVAQALQRRCSVHEQMLPPDQAQMAAMLELSLALTWLQR